MTELEYDLGSFLLTVSRFAAFLLEWYECRHVFRYSHLLLSRRLVVKVIILSFSSVQIPHLEGVVDTGGMQWSTNWCCGVYFSVLDTRWILRVRFPFRILRFEMILCGLHIWSWKCPLSCLCTMWLHCCLLWRRLGRQYVMLGSGRSSGIRPFFCNCTGVWVLGWGVVCGGCAIVSSFWC